MFQFVEKPSQGSKSVKTISISTWIVPKTQKKEKEKKEYKTVKNLFRYSPHRLQRFTAF